MTCDEASPALCGSMEPAWRVRRVYGRMHLVANIPLWPIRCRSPGDCSGRMFCNDRTTIRLWLTCAGSAPGRVI